MYSWRITKYNPDYRNKEGAFLKDDWKSFDDIGKVFNGIELKLSDYLCVENYYVDAIIEFMKCLEISSLEVYSLEKQYNTIKYTAKAHQEIYPIPMISLFKSIQNGYILDFSKVEYLSRLILREHLWCKLEKKLEKNLVMFVHFGYDYYMYVGSQVKCLDAVEKIKDLGLFVEPFKSPYIE